MMNMNLLAILGFHHGTKGFDTSTWIFNDDDTLGNWSHFVSLCIWEGHVNIHAESFPREGLLLSCWIL